PRPPRRPLLRGLPGRERALPATAVVDLARPVARTGADDRARNLGRRQRPARAAGAVARLPPAERRPALAAAAAPAPPWRGRGRRARRRTARLSTQPARSSNETDSTCGVC